MHAHALKDDRRQLASKMQFTPVATPVKGVHILSAASAQAQGQMQCCTVELVIII